MRVSVCQGVSDVISSAPKFNIIGLILVRTVGDDKARVE